MLARNKILIISNKSESYYIRPEDIAYIKAAGNYSDIYLKDGSFISALLIQLGEIAKKINSLDVSLSRLFAIVGRSIIVNTDLIMRISPAKQELLIDHIEKGARERTILNPSVKALQQLRTGMDMGEAVALTMGLGGDIRGAGFASHLARKNRSEQFFLSDDETLFLGI